MNLKKIINLSPLVDVLMIVIFWYIMMSNQTIEETKESAQNELSALQNRYEAELIAAEEENAELTEQVNRLTGAMDELTNENNALELMLEQSVGYLYIRLYDGLHKNRLIEITSDTGLVDKFVFSSGEEEFLRERIEKVVTEYATGEGKKRVALIFLYEGNSAYYLDVTQIKNILYGLRAKHNLAVLMLNLAE